MLELKSHWKVSRLFRILLIAALLYAVLRMGIQTYMAMDMAVASESTPEGQSASDLQIYVNAARHFAERSDLYLKGSLAHLETHYPYSPAFALFFMPILLLPAPILIPLDLLLHIAAYALLYRVWLRIFKRLELARVTQVLSALLPLWILFSAFWDDVSYLNIYIIMALVASYFIEAVLDEKPLWAAFWLGFVILPIKPHWAFAAALPLLLGRYRFFGKLLGGTLVGYALTIIITLALGGLPYGLQQYTDYFQFLARLSRDFPWRGPAQPFLGYNHSVLQSVLYYGGVSLENMRLATLLKVLLLVPLGVVGLRQWWQRLDQRGRDVPVPALDYAFSLYLGAFIWLDMVWELSLGLVIFIYLIGTVDSSRLRGLLWFIFIPYALIDVWRLVSYLLFGDAILYDGAYVLSDPLIYLPWIMFTLLTFYTVLIARRWQALNAASSSS